MKTGIIKRLVSEKGYGFLREDGTAAELFFHRSAVVPKEAFDDLRDGDKVTFDEEKSDKGPRAGNVRKA